MIVNRTRLAVAFLACACAAPLAAKAQTPSYAARGETIRGTIASVQSVNHIFVDDDRGYTDDVTLRSGAAVVSNGVRLEPGQRVTISGAAAGRTFLATRISTNGRAYSAGSDGSQVSYSYPVGVPVYYPAPAYYAQPAYYGYGPYFYGFSFGFGYRYGYGYGYRGYRPYYGRPYYGRPYYGGYGGGYRGGYHPVSVGVRVHFR